MQGRWLPSLQRESSCELVQSKLVTWSPVSACHMGIILPHLPLEAGPRFDDRILSSAAVWTWTNKAAQQNREPGGSDPQRYPCTPTPSLASVISNEERDYPECCTLPLSLAHSLSIDFCFNKWLQTCAGCCGVRDAGNCSSLGTQARFKLLELQSAVAVCRASEFSS